MKSALFTFFLASLMVLTSGAAFGLHTGVTDLSASFSHETFAPAEFNGNVTIMPSGNIVWNGTGTHVIAETGNYYNMTGNINGTLTVLHDNTIFNGVGHKIYNSSDSRPLVSILNTTGVTFRSTIVYGGNYSLADIWLNNTSTDQIQGLNLYYSKIGVYVENYTHDVNISDSIVVPAVYGVSGMLLGLDYSGSGALSVSHSSYRITAFNDSVSAVLTIAGVLIGANDSKLLDSHISASGNEVSVATSSNYTFMSGNNIKVSKLPSIGVTLSGISGYPLYNITFSDNTVSGNVTSSSSIPFQLVGEGSINGNIFSFNANGNSVSPIDLNYGNASFTGNSVTVYNGTSTYSYDGVLADGPNYTISSNTVNITTGVIRGIAVSNSMGGASPDGDSITHNTLLLNSTGATGITSQGVQISNSTISDNYMKLSSGSNSDIGITLGGNNDNIDSNSIYLNVTGSPSYIYGIGNYEYSPSVTNTNVSGNYINITGTPTQPYGIYYTGSPSYLSITGNTIIQGTSLNPSGIFVSSGTKVTVSGNYLVADSTNSGSSIEVEVSYSTVSDNWIFGNGNQTGIYIFSDTAVTAYNNTLTDVYDAFFLDNANNVIISGNYVNDTVQYLFFIDGDSGLLVYHNNFFNYSLTPVYIYSSTGYYFNSSYPVGGNYWSANTGLDLYSGPGQNLTGPDGISDSAYLIISGLLDYYPLSYEWKRPLAVFSEKGLMPGTLWSATFNGKQKYSTESTISFSISNGTYQTYSYSVGKVANYKGGGSSGYYSYKGNGFSNTTTYNPYYSLKFTEAGLPSGTTWTLKVNGTTHQVSGSSYTVAVLNNTSVNYDVFNTTLYYNNVGSGSQTVKGSNITIEITYLHFAYINGTVSPASSSVTVNGKPVSVNNGSFSLAVAAGSYSVVVSSKGYNTYYSNFTVTPGEVKVVNATLTKQQATLGGLPIVDYYYIAGGSAAAIAVIASVFWLRRKGH